MLAWAFVAAGAALALPPVTQEEAVAFHTNALCQMKEPGKGITRPDGRGYIVSSLPGKHRLFVNGTLLEIDMTPGRPYAIFAPGGNVAWCPRFVPPGREACGAVPQAFLYDAQLATDVRAER
jgi:hypothetical protein